MRRGAAWRAVVVLASVVGACGPEALSDDEPDTQPTGYGVDRSALDGKADAPRAVLPIRYHGGPVMLGTVHLYYIWYGDWAGNSARAILDNLARHLDDP